MSVNSRLSERCDSDRGISKKVSTQERKIRERVFELHAIKLSIPSCLNLLERLVLGTSAHSPRGGGGGHASIQMCFRSPSLLFSLKPCSTSSRILFNALLYPRVSPISLLARSCRTRRLVTNRILIIRYPCIVSF